MVTGIFCMSCGSIASNIIKDKMNNRGGNIDKKLIILIK